MTNQVALTDKHKKSNRAGVTTIKRQSIWQVKTSVDARSLKDYKVYRASVLEVDGSRRIKVGLSVCYS